MIKAIIYNDIGFETTVEMQIMLSELAAGLIPEAIAIRREFHQQEELSDLQKTREFKTGILDLIV